MNEKKNLRQIELNKKKKGYAIVAFNVHNNMGMSLQQQLLHTISLLLLLKLKIGLASIFLPLTCFIYPFKTTGRKRQQKEKCYVDLKFL